MDGAEQSRAEPSATDRLTPRRYDEIPNAELWELARTELGVPTWDPTSTVAAVRGGSKRLEMFPESAGSMCACLASMRGSFARANVHLRPQGANGWKLDDWDKVALRVDVALAKQHAAYAVVVGPMDACGFLDLELIAELVHSAKPLKVAICRDAFDKAPSRVHSLQALAALGVDAIYTSGTAAAAWDGRLEINELIAAANDARIHVAVRAATLGARM